VRFLAKYTHCYCGYVLMFPLGSCLYARYYFKYAIQSRRDDMFIENANTTFIEFRRNEICIINSDDKIQHIVPTGLKRTKVCASVPKTLHAPALAVCNIGINLSILVGGFCKPDFISSAFVVANLNRKNSSHDVL